MIERKETNTMKAYLIIAGFDYEGESADSARLAMTASKAEEIRMEMKEDSFGYIKVREIEIES